MKLLADECFDASLVALLRQHGHDVGYVIEEDQGAIDATVLQRAFAEERILLTEDKDFGELVYRLQKPAAGIVLLRVPVEVRHLKWQRLQLLLERFPDRLSSHFVTVDEASFRFRPLLGVGLS